MKQEDKDLLLKDFYARLPYEVIFEKVTEWLFENTTEYEFEYWGGGYEEGVKFYDFKSKDDMIDALRDFLNKN